GFALEKPTRLAVLALVLEHALGDLPQLVRHTVADVLPGTGKLRADRLQGRIIQRIVEGAQAAGRFRAQSRIRPQERLDQFPALRPELAHLGVSRLDQPDRKQVNARLEGKANAVEVSANFSVEPADSLELGRIQKALGNVNRLFVRV